MIKKISKGFTLIELIIVVGLIVMMVALVVPGFGNFTRKQSFNNAVKTFISDITSARSKSISGARPTSTNQFKQSEMWGLTINCSATSTAPSKGQYQIVYTYESGANTVAETKNLNFGLATSTPYRITSIGGSCPSTADIYFTRFNGAGSSVKGLFSTTDVVNITMTSDDDPTFVSTVSVFRNGKIVVSP